MKKNETKELKHIKWNCVYFCSDPYIVWSIQDAIDYYVVEKMDSERMDIFQKEFGIKPIE